MGKTGVLGVGHLADAVLRGLMRAGLSPDELLLSPRGLAAELHRAYGIPLARDNADLVTRSSVVLLAVRPADAPDALHGLPWRPDHVVVSACAGVSAERLRAAAAPARIVRIMPLTAAQIGASPTVVFPDDPAIRPLLDPLGPVVAVDSEEAFEVATVHAAIYGWVQDLIGRSAEWSGRQGLAPEAARRLSALTFVAAGRLVDEQPEPVPELLRSLVTPGGITELGLGVLKERGATDAWTAACDAVLARLQPGTST
jgi:pyrroline-5-carboxylate reductase